MTKAVAELPDDVDALKAMIVAMADQRALLEARNSHLEVATKTDRGADGDREDAGAVALRHSLGAPTRRDIERGAACLRVRRNRDRHGGD